MNLNLVLSLEPQTLQSSSPLTYHRFVISFTSSHFSAPSAHCWVLFLFPATLSLPPPGLPDKGGGDIPGRHAQHFYVESPGLCLEPRVLQGALDLKTQLPGDWLCSEHGTELSYPHAPYSTHLPSAFCGAPTLQCPLPSFQTRTSRLGRMPPFSHLAYSRICQAL